MTVYTRAGAAFGLGLPAGASVDVAKATDSSDASRGAANLLAPKPTTNALGGGLITEKAKENWLQDIADRADTIGGPSLGEKYLMPGLAWVGDQFTKVGTYYEAVDRYTARSQDEGSALGEYAGATLFRLPGAAWLDPDFHEEWDAAKESAASTGQTAWLSVTRGDTEYQDTYAILDDPMNQIPTVNEDGTTGPSARDEYFSPWYRKFATGTFDFAFTFYADPTILGGKALGVARATRNTINISDASAAYARTTAMHAGADEAAQAIAATTAREGISDLAPLRFRADGSTTGELRVAATVSRAVEASEVARKAALAGKAGGYAALARTSLLSQAADGGGIAYLMQRTDAITDDAVRLAVKRDVFYAGMGVKPAIKSLKQKSDMIALELEAMNGPNRAAIIGGLMVRNDIPYADILRKIDADSWTDEVMAAHADEIAKFRQGLENYDSGLQRAIATGTRGLPVDAKGFSGVGELAKMDDFAGKYDFMRVAKTIQRGAALPPIHVLVGTHIPGVIRISDDVAPDIFEQSVSRTAKALGDKKLNAQMMVLAERFRLAQGEAFPGASRMARRDIVIEFEKLVEKALVTKHTAHLKDAEAIATRSAQIRSAITEIKRRRLDETTHLDERMQSLIPGKGAKGYTQDEFGVYSLPSVKRAADDATPFAATQGQDTIALVDYKKLSKMLDENLDPLDGYMRLRAGSRDAWEFTTAGISAFVDLWKFGALFRAGYFVRNQIDNQARLLATIGSLEMFHNTFAGLKNQRFNRGWISEAEAIAGREHLNAQAWIRTIDDDLTFASDDAAFARLWGERAEADKALKAAQARLTQARNSRLVKRGKGKNAVRRGQTVQARHLGLRDGDYTAAYSSIDDYARTHQQISAHRSIVGLMTGGEASELARYRAQRIRASLPTAESGRVRAIGYKHPRWADEYATFVNHRVRNDHALMMVLNGESDDAIRAYYTGTHEGRAQWADLSKRWPESARRDGLDNLIRHQREQMDLAFPTESMKTRARAGDIDANWARESFPVREQRPGVPADLYEGINSAKVSEFYTRPRDWFFKYAAEIPETMLGRHPFYVSRFNMHMQQIIAGAGGRKSFESLTLREINAARSRASVLARREIGNYLFDTARRSNLSHYLRFIAPFYSAWSDTMRKWARIGGENPWVFPVMGKVFMAPNASLLVTDEDGNRIDSAGNVLGADGEVIRKSADFTEGIIHLPTPDWLSTRLVGNKGDFTVRKSSLNTIFQGEPFFLPSVGPLVQYPVNEVLVNAFPEFADNPVAKYILPTGTNANSNPIAQTAPSTARNLWTALATDLNDDRFAQTYMKLMADEINAQESGQAPQRSAAELQKLVTNRARNWYLVSALGSFSGFTVTPTSRLEYWRNEYRRYQREYAGDAKQKFYDDHPDYFEATISLSENETGITATDESWRAAEKYRDEIKANPEYGWLFVGAENMVPGFDAGVYTAQKALGQRTTKDPGEALRDMEIQRGWLRYQRVAGALELKLQEREEHGGSGSLSAKSNSDLKAIKDKFVSTLADENPAWANAYEAGGTGSAIGEFLRTAMQAVADRPELADRADFQTLFSYIALRRQVQQELADRGLTSLNANDATDLRDAWVTSVQRLVRNDVGFEQMYTRARLERDDLTLMRDSE